MRVVISQPMYFPWPGHMEQIASADVYVFYDDVQFSKGSFTNRVKIRQSHGTQWLTVPLQKHPLTAQIREISVHDPDKVATSHAGTFGNAYRNAPWREDALNILQAAFTTVDGNIAMLSAASTTSLSRYLGCSHTRFEYSSKLAIPGCSWERVLRICQFFNATEYVTGHGALNYLDHAAFDAAGIQVLYADYSLAEYPQLGEGFTPYVSTLDLIAMTGPDARSYIRPTLVPWRDFQARRMKEAADR
jgi:hypothetical protein